MGEKPDRQNQTRLMEPLVPHPLPVAVVIPTFNRPALLANRALPAVAAQTHPPAAVLVVDDSAPRERRLNREIVASARLSRSAVIYRENARTPGAAGAWNTALEALRSRFGDCWVALLDDDDAWLPSYLETCVQAGEAMAADVVVAGLIRKETDKADHFHQIPHRIEPDDFLRGNPHWQGSNTFARLSVLLAAGGFDESFASTNDRDLGIRLLDMSWIRWHFLPEHLVLHYADDRLPRLSRKGSPGKHAGLLAFYQKYRGRMSSGTAALFRERAVRVFGAGEDLFAETPPQAAVTLPQRDSNLRLPAILIGTISSPAAGITCGFIREVAGLAARNPDTRITLVVMDNSGADNPERPRLMAALRELDAYPSVRWHHRMCEGNARLPIASARTHLQHFCYEVLEGRQMPVWILDDDVRMALPADRGTHIDWHHCPDHFGMIAALAASGADVVIGSVTGEPPLPFLSTVRVQLVDLLHNLYWFAGLEPDGPFPSRHAENQVLRKQYKDYYYDLAKSDTGHLERPFWYEPRQGGLTTGEALVEMIHRLEGIFTGCQVFRPIIWTPSVPADGLMPGLNRGPNTLIFNPACLVALPNIAPVLGGVATRRSDMNWALLGKYGKGWRVVSADIPVCQDRSGIPSGGALDFATLAQDIRGHAVFNALSDWLLDRQLLARQEGVQVPPSAPLPVEELMLATEAGLARRLSAWEQNSLRVKALGRVLAGWPENPACRSGWMGSARFAQERDLLRAWTERLNACYAFDPGALGREVHAFEREALRTFYTTLSPWLQP